VAESENWRAHARWALGEVSGAEYADHLVSEGLDEDEPIVRILRDPDRRSVTLGEPER
jgi:hypothetical protein